MNEVTLVSYLGGVRRVVGTARIHEEAEGLRVEGIIQDSDTARQLRGDAMESLCLESRGVQATAFDLGKTNECMACFLGLCGQGADDKDCVCCKTAHES